MLPTSAPYGRKRAHRARDLIDHVGRHHDLLARRQLGRDRAEDTPGLGRVGLVDADHREGAREALVAALGQRPLLGRGLADDGDLAAGQDGRQQLGQVVVGLGRLAGVEQLAEVTQHQDRVDRARLAQGVEGLALPVAEVALAGDQARAVEEQDRALRGRRIGRRRRRGRRGRCGWRGGGQAPGQLVQDGRLAGAGRPDQHQRLGLGHGQARPHQLDQLVAVVRGLEPAGLRQLVPRHGQAIERRRRRRAARGRAGPGPAPARVVVPVVVELGPGRGVAAVGLVGPDQLGRGALVAIELAPAQVAQAQRRQLELEVEEALGPVGPQRQHHALVAVDQLGRQERRGLRRRVLAGQPQPHVEPGRPHLVVRPVRRPDHDVDTQVGRRGLGLAVHPQRRHRQRRRGGRRVPGQVEQAPGVRPTELIVEGQGQLLDGALEAGGVHRQRRLLERRDRDPAADVLAHVAGEDEAHRRARPN